MAAVEPAGPAPTTMTSGELTAAVVPDCVEDDDVVILRDSAFVIREGTVYLSSK